MVRSGVDCHWKGQVVGTVGRRLVAIHSSGQTISSLAHIEGITLGGSINGDNQDVRRKGVGKERRMERKWLQSLMCEGRD